jgi:O-antigen/teichoic acid export membrane protein
MSSYNKQIVNNSIFSVIQVFVVSICAFFLYKYIIQILGIEKLGLWSLILSVTSLATIGNFGFTGSLVKFSAELSVLNKYKQINAILNSSILGVSLILGVVLLLIFLFSYNFISYLVDEKWIAMGQNLLLYALISLYINIIAGLYFSILDGLNFAYLKSLSFIFVTIVYTILSMFLIVKYDLIGLAYAQVCQAFLFLILGIVLNLIYVKGFKFFYFKWHKELMKKVFNYGMSFQMIGLAQMFYDPITKAILSRFGGLDFVAIFEMASKLVIQVRAIPASILQNLVPKIVTLKTTLGHDKITEAYKKMNVINLFLNFSTLVIILPFSNIISILLLGESDESFICVLIVTTIGWLINSLNISAYIVNLGTGNLKWNVISHLIIGVLNLLFCFSVGYFFRNGLYIIFSWILALIIGSILIVLEYHNRNKISLNIIFSRVFFKLFGFLTLLSLLSYFVNINVNNFFSLLIIQGILILVYYLVIILTIKELKENIIFILQTKKLKQ